MNQDLNKKSGSESGKNLPDPTNDSGSVHNSDEGFNNKKQVNLKNGFGILGKNFGSGRKVENLPDPQHCFAYQLQDGGM